MTTNTQTVKLTGRTPSQIQAANTNLAEITTTTKTTITFNVGLADAHDLVAGAIEAIRPTDHGRYAPEAKGRRAALRSIFRALQAQL